MNNDGPSIEPWATPIETGAISKHTSLQLVTCFLFVKNEVTQALAVSSNDQDLKASDAILYD